MIDMELKQIQIKNNSSGSSYIIPEPNKKEHDNILIWLDLEILSVAKRIIKYEENWDIRLINKVKKESEKYIKDRINQLEESVKKYPKDNDYMARDCKLIEEYQSWKYPNIPKKEFNYSFMWQLPIDNNNIIGFIDIFFEAKTTKLDVNLPRACNSSSTFPNIRVLKNERFEIAFIIKPEMPSLYELIREIRIYKQYSEEEYCFYVVSSDDSYVKHLTKQGIGFVKYPTGKIFRPENDL